MSEALWQWQALVDASGGVGDGVAKQSISGVSIDSRSLVPGELFVALKDVRDGHDFVPAAFAAGAAAALVERGYRAASGEEPLIRVDDVQSALEAIGQARRQSLTEEAKIVAITGSVGKTTTKEMLRLCLSAVGPTHAATKSFNNHWGVPLTLARMPEASRYGIFEIGMNHPGEIRPLSQMVRPDVAIITAIAPVHIGHFASEAAICDEKAEIFAGLPRDGIAVLNHDTAHFNRLSMHARAAGLQIVTFGTHEAADVRVVDRVLGENGSKVVAALGRRQISYQVGAPGQHLVMNSLAVAAALQSLDLPLEQVLAPLAAFEIPDGRGVRQVLAAKDGEILLVDESYNANPASMSAALAALALIPRDRFGRRIAVLGDMLELGDQAQYLHVGLKEAIDEAGVDLVFACGPNMQLLYNALEPSKRGYWAEDSAGIEGAVLDLLRLGDAVMVKGSLGSRMAPIVTRIKRRFQSSDDAQ